MNGQQYRHLLDTRTFALFDLNFSNSLAYKTLNQNLFWKLIIGLNHVHLILKVLPTVETPLQQQQPEEENTRDGENNNE